MKLSSFAAIVVCSLSVLMLTPLDFVPSSEVATTSPVPMSSYVESGGCFKNDWANCLSFGLDRDPSCPCQNVDQMCYGAKFTDNTQNLGQIPTNIRIAILEEGYVSTSSGNWCDYNMTYCVGTCQFDQIRNVNYCPGSSFSMGVPSTSASGAWSACDDIYAKSSPQQERTRAIAAMNGVGLISLVKPGA